MRTSVLCCGVTMLLAAGLGLMACKETAPTSATSASSVARGARDCADCHTTQARLWRDGEHRQLACHRCHGPGTAHAAATTRPRPAMPPTGGAGACLSCHRKLGSFDAHVKTIEAKHVVKANVERAKGQCIYCHDPHSLQ